MGLLIAGGLAFALGLILESTTSWIAIRTARKHYPDLWEHSGKPTLLGNGDLMNAWPLVNYYRNRKYLEPVQYEDHVLQPITEKNTLEFADKLRKPLVYAYYAGWGGVAVLIICLIGPSIFG